MIKVLVKKKLNEGAEPAQQPATGQQAQPAPDASNPQQPQPENPVKVDELSKQITDFTNNIANLIKTACAIDSIKKSIPQIDVIANAKQGGDAIQKITDSVTKMKGAQDANSIIEQYGELLGLFKELVENVSKAQPAAGQGQQAQQPAQQPAQQASAAPAQ